MAHCRRSAQGRVHFIKTFSHAFFALVRLSQDSNILRKFTTDGEWIHRLECVPVHVWSFEAKYGKEERLAAVTTAAAIFGPST